MDNQKMYQIEWLRFLLSIIIVYYHILHANIMDYAGACVERYEALAEQSVFASAIVQCFFILAGFFLHQSYMKYPEETIGRFAYKKFLRLWPVLAFSIIIGVLFFQYKLYPQLFNLLFLQSIGVSLEYKGINWYISPYFFVILFYYAILKCSRDKRKVNLFIGLLVYFAYVLNIETTGGGFGRETVYGVLNLGVFQAVAGIGLGYLLGETEKCIKGWFSQMERGKKSFLLPVLIISLVEVVNFTLLMIDFLRRDYAYKNQFIIVILFSILLLCMASGKGILSRIFNRKLFGMWGKYSYSIYVMQQISFYVLQKTLWKQQDFVENHMYRCLLVSILFSMAVGITTYYVIEKPSAKVLRKRI